VIGLLEGRVVALEAEIAFGESLLRGTLEHGLLRIFLIEEEYALTIRRAELEFVRGLIDELAHGELWPDRAALEALVEREKQRGGAALE
jgi:hypothetical protein